MMERHEVQSGRLHCESCSSDPAGSEHLIVYNPNEKAYGRCDKCEQVRWETELWPNSRSSSNRSSRSAHCGCCKHPHDLKPGGHTVMRITRVDRA